MNKSHLLFLVFALMGFNSVAQWVLQNSGTTNNLNSIYFTDANSGCAVGDSGIILKTSDGGANWTAKSSGTIQNLRSVCFTDADAGYAVGDSGVILKTMDEGANWSPQISGTDRNLASINFPAANTGYAVGQYGTILKTQDAGITWIDLSTYTTYNSTSVFFTDEYTGFLAAWTPYGWGSCGIILKTINGGIDWTLTYEMCSQFGARFRQVFFTDSNIGYAIGSIYIYESSPVHIKTLNAGTDWISAGCGIWPYAIYFPTIDTGYIVGADLWMGSGDYNICKITNGGTYLTLQNAGTPGVLKSVYFSDVETGYVVGENGAILKTTNGGGNPVGINQKPQTTSMNIYPNPANDKITISSPSSTGITQLSIFNVSGEKVIGKLLNDNETQIDISALPSGVYFVQLQNEKMVEVGKIVKE